VFSLPGRLLGGAVDYHLALSALLPQGVHLSMAATAGVEGHMPHVQGSSVCVDAAAGSSRRYRPEVAAELCMFVLTCVPGAVGSLLACQYVQCQHDSTSSLLLCLLSDTTCISCWTHEFSG